MSGPVPTVTRYLIALAVVSCLAAPAGADDGTPVAGTLNSSPTLIPNVRVLSGSVTPFGNIQGLLSLNINQQTGAFTGGFVIKAKKGYIIGTVEGQFLSATTYLESITFVVGTGPYWGIHGEVDLFGTIDPMTGKGVDVIVSGTVDLP